MSEEAKLERFIHQELRRLPERPAPPELAGKVMESLERRRSLPWWRQSLWHWSAAARAGWLTGLALLCTASIGLAFQTMQGWTPEGWGLAARVQPWLAHWESLVTWWDQGSWFARQTMLQPVLWGVGSAMVLSFLLLLGAGTLMLRLTEPTFKRVTL